MRGATPFTRHRFGGRGRSVVELEMGWGEGASRSLVERILTALLPALSAGEMEIAQVVSGDRRSRKAKLDISKVGAAIETSGGDSIWLSGRPGRGYASLIGTSDAFARYTRAMGSPARRRATYEDLLGAPAHVVAEILDGTLVTHPRPASFHARASSRLGVELGGPFDRGKGGPGGWILLDEPELHMREDVLVPDLAGWRRERMPELPDTAAFELAPDWICAVLSPSTASMDRAKKMPIYARERVAHVWLVDPIARTLEAFRLENDRWTVLGAWRDDAKVRAEPFGEFELELAGLWAK